MKLRDFGLIGTVLLTMVPAPAQAQPEFIKETATKIIRRVGVRANMSFRDPVDPDVSKGTTFGLSVGLGPGHTNGWRYPIGFTMFSENLHSPNGEPCAVMRSTAIVAGIGYSHHFGRLSTGASLQTGFAFNRGRTEGDMQRAFGVPDSAVSVDVGNSLLLRPHVKAEYFFTPTFAFRVSADYVLIRPDIAVSTPTERITDRWDTSNAHATVGVSFYPFRK